MEVLINEILQLAIASGDPELIGYAQEYKEFSELIQSVKNKMEEDVEC